MKKQIPQDLIQKYLSGKATTKERVTLESWYLLHSENMRDKMPEPDYELLESQMWPVIDAKTTSIRKRFRLWPQIAAAVAFIAIGIYLYQTSDLIFSRNAETVMKNDIAPGKNRATLTLTNGEVINLSDVNTGVVINNYKVAYNDGRFIRNSTLNVDENITAATPRGGTYQIILPDGTKVWLNAQSSLKFPATFSGVDSRKVELKGEAYFEVSKDKKKPFLVHAGRQQVQVLGTHFNINAYDDSEGIRTTLLEGSVKVGVMNPAAIDKRTGMLKPGVGTIIAPGQQAELIYGLPIKLVQANLEEAMAWKNGQFMFNQENLQTIMLRVARWYDVEVVYSPGFKSEPFTGSVSRFANISSVLKVLELTGTVHFKIEGRRVTVMR